MHNLYLRCRTYGSRVFPDKARINRIHTSNHACRAHGLRLHTNQWGHVIRKQTDRTTEHHTHPHALFASSYVVKAQPRPETLNSSIAVKAQPRNAYSEHISAGIGKDDLRGLLIRDVRVYVSAGLHVFLCAVGSSGGCLRFTVALASRLRLLCCWPR